MCVCMCVCAGFTPRLAVEPALSQSSARAAHTGRELVGQNRMLQLVKEGLSEGPHWSLIPTGGPGPGMEGWCP